MKPRPEGLAERVAAALFALALLQYPRDFRDHYGPSMKADFLRRGRAAVSTGATALYRMRAILETVPSAARVRLDALRGWPADVVGAARGLARAPAITVVSMSIIAVGVGGGALIFSVLYGVLLQPLPYEHADRTLVVWTFNERQGLPDGSSYLNMEDWAARSRTVDAWGWYFRPDFTKRTLTGDGTPLRVDAGAVNAAFFETVGVEPIAGRVFTEDEERAGAPVVLISARLWRDRFAEEPLEGLELEVDGRPRTVIGVLPSDLEMPLPGTLLWEPHSILTGWPEERGGRRDDAFVALARVAPGFTAGEAEAELHRISADLRAAHPEENRDLGVVVRPLLEELTGDEIPRTLWLLQAAAILVLLAVAANVGHVWLVRAVGRRRDLAVRLAMGASRPRVVRLLFAEGALITLVASTAGLAFAALALGPILRLVPPDLPRVAEISLNPAVAGLTLAVAMILGGGASMLAALVAARVAPTSIVRDGGRAIGRGRSQGLRSAFVIAQMAVAMTLVLGAGVFVRSFDRVQAVDPGFDPDGVLVARIELPMMGSGDPDSFVRELTARLDAIPAVRSSGAVSDYMFRRFPDGGITPEGREGEVDGRSVPLMTDSATPGFFATAGWEFVRGGPWVERPREDGVGAQAVVNEAAAQAFWPGEDPVGKRFQWGTYDEAKSWNVVVGVVRNTLRGGLTEAPIAQIVTDGPLFSMDLTLRTDGDPLSLVPALLGVLKDVDPTLAPTWVADARSLLSRELGLWRLRTTIALGAAGLVATLAMLGMYGLLTEAVNSRRRELGIRMALGAVPGALRNAVLSRGLGLATIGAVTGVGVVALASRALSSFLYEVTPLDPLTLVTVAAVVMGFALLASWIPARRATRIDPARCLTSD